MRPIASQTEPKTTPASPSLVPPDIVARAGQAVVTAYAEMYATVFATARNDQFAVAAGDFVHWLTDQCANLQLEHVVEDNVVAHLEDLSVAGCSESELLARLCAIDLLLEHLSDPLPRLRTLARTQYSRPVPPRLLVESSDESHDFVGVYADFLTQHTNPRTKASYETGLRRFFDSVGSDVQGARLQDVRDMTGTHVAAFIVSVRSVDEDSGLVDDKPRTVGSVLSAVRTYLDACIAAGLLDKNVARAVRLPKTPTGRGATPVVEPDVVRRMIDAIPMETQADYRDRAVIAMMAYSLFRVSAVCRMRVRDYQMRGNLRYLVSVEKRSKVHEMPVHDMLAHYLDDYLMTTGLIDRLDAPLFQGSVPRSGKLNGRTYSRVASWKMIQRRAKAAGHFGEIGNHSLRATGITTYLAHGGALEEAQKMAGHASAETTRLYDRNTYSVDPDEVDRIRY